MPFIKRIRVVLISAFSLLFTLGCSQSSERKEWKINADWGHWILGHRNNMEFLQKNHMTVTFGSGAPNFENVTRSEFDSLMDESKKFNKEYHDSGYIVLRYLSTSLNGNSRTRTSEPHKTQLHLMNFYKNQWSNFEDYIGPKPAEDPTTWMMIRPDGTFPYYRYAPYGKETDEGFEAWGCPDNPHYLRYMEGKIRAQTETGIDGSYVDWTHFAGGTCYCKYTKKNFIQYLKEFVPPEVGKVKYGINNYNNIKLPEKRGDNFWIEWITYRGYRVAEFHKQLRNIAKQYNPEFMISGNVFGGFGYGPIAYDAAGNIEMLGREGYDDFIYSEMQEYLDAAPRKDKNNNKITNSPALKFLAAASHGKPTIVYATEITPPIFPNPTEKCLSAMAQLNIAEAVANHAIFREKRETPTGATEIYNFLSAHRDKMVGSHLYSNIAVLASLNQFLADELSFAFSASRILADEGVSHVMIVEDDLLSSGLNEFDLIYIPYLPLLNQQKLKALRKYVANGGNLLILGKSGVKNEFNLPHKQNEFLGMLQEDDFPGQFKEKQIGKGMVSYIPLKIPPSKFLIPVKAKGDVTTFGPAMTDIFADIPEGYTRNRIDPELRKVLYNAYEVIIGMLRGRAAILSKSSPYVEMTTMLHKSQSHMLVHLVNYNVTIDGDITPADDLKVQLILPQGKKIKNFKFSGTLSQMVPLAYREIQDGPKQIISFELDAVNIYGLAIVELE